MRIAFAPLLLAAALGSGAAFAADPPAATPGQGIMGSAMMGGGRMDFGAMQCMDQSDARLAAVKADLKLTSAQLPLWNAVVEAEKANAQVMRQSMATIMQGGGAGQGPQGRGPGGMMGSGPLPERLERHEKMMTAHLDALRKVKAAVSPFYASLTPEQKTVADRSLCGPMGGGAGPGMMGRRPS
jgi:hypothetical protein